MGIYFKEEQKKPRWESGQAILHRETRDTEKTERADSGEKAGQSGKTAEAYGVKNSYGKLRYLKKGEKRGQEKEGFSLEAFEAPGTPLHTEKEKRLDRAAMKNITHGDKQMLFASEIPLRSQALFYDLAGSKKSEDFLECMKQLIHARGHQTLSDTFGFLDQESERMELETLKAEQKEPLLDEPEYSDARFYTDMEKTSRSKQMDILNSRLLRKESKERQLRSELQLMLDQRAKEENRADFLSHIQEGDGKQQKDKEKRNHDDSLRRLLQPDSGAAGTAENEAEQPEDEEDPVTAGQ